ncbi:MAG: OmpA family protein [Sedimentisphaerales bacterium]|jgi:flagellar motor protein MotB
MFMLRKRIMLAAVAIVSLALISGCTDYKKKYNSLNVEHQNLQGLYDNCKSTLEGSNAEKEGLAAKVSENQQTIDELKKQMSSRKQTAGEATGFGNDYQVDLDKAAGTITVTVPEMILFDSGKATLKASAKGSLSKIVSVLNEKYGGSVVDVIGHTDADPIKKSSWKDNWELSAQRSLSVLRQLNSDGVPDSRLRAIGCGSGRPVAPNSGGGKAKNRRVEIVVHTKAV